MKKITLFLMTEKGLECLRTIIQTFGAESIAQVFTHDDTSVENDYSREICDLCDEGKIEWTYEYGEGGGNGQTWKEEGIKTDFVIAIGWRWLIDTDKTVLVLHDSLLPKYKGWNPLVTSLINGDIQIGVSVFRATDKADQGNVITREAVYIKYPIKIAEAINTLIPIYQGLCCLMIKKLGDKKYFSFLEKEYKDALKKNMGSYSMWRDEEDYRIDWSWSADKIVRFVDAVGFPYQGAFTNTNYWEGKITVADCEVYFSKTEVEISDRQKHIGKVIFREGDKYVVIAGEGLVQINKMLVQATTEIVHWNKFRIRFK